MGFSSSCIGLSLIAYVHYVRRNEAYLIRRRKRQLDLSPTGDGQTDSVVTQSQTKISKFATLGRLGCMPQISRRFVS